jgi:elongation factor P
MVERRLLQYLYKDNIHLVFMDMNTFEQLEVPLEDFEHLLPYLKENEEVTVVLHEGRVIDVVLPYTVELTVLSAMPGAKGDTATGATKPVEVETGATIQVPLFVNEGDVIKVDTRTGEYLTRA